jgi:hypothetical protein
VRSPAPGSPLKKASACGRRDDVEIVKGDVRDPGSPAQPPKAPKAVYQTLAPPDHQWLELFHALQYEFLEPFVGDSSKFAIELGVPRRGPGKWHSPSWCCVLRADLGAAYSGRDRVLPVVAPSVDGDWPAGGPRGAAVTAARPSARRVPPLAPMRRPTKATYEGDPPRARGNPRAGRWRGSVPTEQGRGGRSRSPRSKRDRR